MKLVQLRIYSGDPETPGEAVYVAPDNVGMVENGMADPPASQVWLKVGVPMLLVEGSPQRVAAMVDAALMGRTHDDFRDRAHTALGERMADGRPLRPGEVIPVR